MKTWIQFILAVLCTTILFQPNIAQDRPALWVHSLGENAQTWAIYNEIFNTERQINGLSNSYVVNQGIPAFANNIAAVISANFPGTIGVQTQNIGIGHGLGGLALRELARTRTGGNKSLQGLITVGSPNEGAPIINSIRNGRVLAATTDACVRLQAGPRSESPFRNVSVSGVPSSVLCGIMSSNFLNPLFQNQANNPSVDDIVPESSFLTTLNSNAPSIPAISIRGNENSPVHWRLLSSFISNNANDTEYVQRAMLMREYYNTSYIYNLSLAAVTGIFSFFNPVFAKFTAMHLFRAIEWNKGKKWFDQSENIWNGLIGCTGERVTRTVSFTGNVCNGFTTGTPQWVNCLQNQCGGMIENCIQTISYSFSILVNNSSDGLLCDQTQLIDGLPDDNYYEARGVNHMEQTNTTNGTTADGRDVMRDIFNLIWSRTDEFATPTR